jgi:nanoRNase/pAp phosphatase (c-di-AMP/oligoRNAs hydrolase)
MPQLDQNLTIRERVAFLLNVVAGGDRALICTHDNPDPDSIASAWALGRLIEEKTKIPSTLTYGGILGRAENRAMVRLLKIPLVPVHRLELDDFDVVALVDTQPEARNHALPADRVSGKKMICVDHHPARDRSRDADYADVGGDFGATSTLLTHYLHVSEIEAQKDLATALFYGIKSDTQDLGREVSNNDLWAYTHLISKTDMQFVSAIEHPRLPRAYFGVLMRAIQKAEVHGNVVSCDLGEVYVPDLVAETADRLSFAEGMRWSLVVGEYQDDIYASIRVNDRRYSAGKMVREVITSYPKGGAGGHGSMAGARLPHSPRAKSRAARTRARRKFLRSLVAATGVDIHTKGEKFVPTDISQLESTLMPPMPNQEPAAPTKRNNGSSS